jgi:superfamily II DNA/RNA helicase
MADLHGNLSQRRDRNLAAFTTGEARARATDIAARGVHVDAVELVVHVDPADHKAYLHRSGPHGARR